MRISQFLAISSREIDVKGKFLHIFQHSNPAKDDFHLVSFEEIDFNIFFCFQFFPLSNPTKLSCA